MNSMQLRPLAIATTALALGSVFGHAHAQMAPVIPPSQFQGPFAGQAIGVQLSPVGSEVISPLRIRTPGFTSGDLEPWTATRFGAAENNHPDYSPRALFEHWVPQIWTPSTAWDAALASHNPRFGGMCTGGDLTPRILADGRMEFGGVEGVSWYTLSFTVGAGSAGLEGSAIRMAVDESPTATPAGWIYTYVVEGGTRIRAELVDTVSVEYTGSQFPGATGGTPRDIEALDWGMGMISVTGNEPPSTLQPHRNRLYFTLDQRWITDVLGSTPPQMQVLDGSGPYAQVVSADINSATVYAMVWDNGAWSLPMVAFTPEDLFGAVSYSASIDALSVDSRPSDLPENPTRVVFSLTQGSTVGGQAKNEILVTQPGNSAIGLADVKALPLLTPSGAMVSEKIGLSPSAVSGISIGPDAVDGLCGRDPREQQDYDIWVATPVDLTDETSATMGVTIGRLFDGYGDGEPVEHMLLAAHGIDLGPWDLGLLVFDFDLLDQPLPLKAEEFAFVTVDSTTPAIVWPGSSTAEWIFPFSKPSVSHIRVRARLHGVDLDPFVVEPDYLQSWVTILGRH